jgi:hypothetical protein
VILVFGSKPVNSKRFTVTDEPQSPVKRIDGGPERNGARKWQFWTASFILGGAYVLAFTRWGGAAILLVLLAGVVLADGILRKDAGLEPNEGQ